MTSEDGLVDVAKNEPVTKYAPTVVTFPYTDHNLECPFCTNRLEIMVDVNITGGSARYSGSGGFRENNFSVTLDKEIREVRVEHTCTGARGRNGTG